LIVGAGVGVAAVAAPLYAAELAPTSLRGRFVSAYQLAITVGIFLAYLVDGWLSKSDSWRLMLGASAVPGLLLFVVALVAPESPRWLMKMNRRADAAMQIRKIRPGVERRQASTAVGKRLLSLDPTGSVKNANLLLLRAPVDCSKPAEGVIGHDLRSPSHEPPRRLPEPVFGAQGATSYWASVVANLAGHKSNATATRAWSSWDRPAVRWPTDTGLATMAASTHKSGTVPSDINE
jgi:MFS family permease